MYHAKAWLLELLRQTIKWGLPVEAASDQKPTDRNMIADHPNIASAILIAMAVLAHWAKEAYSPIQFRSNWETGWFELKANYDSDNISVFRLFSALKWFCIGLVFAIQWPQVWS